MSIVTRFAPSPTGFLHLGHAYSAWTGWRRAQAGNGRFLLRLEDIDSGRCRPEYAAAIVEDLGWLGLPVAPFDEIRLQSRHMAEYAAAIAGLEARGLLYPCFCTRSEIAAAMAAPHGTAAIYPGTCRDISVTARKQNLAAQKPYALRLNVSRAIQSIENLKFLEEGVGWITAEPGRLGDVVLARRDVPASYHLCVVHDDAAQGITHVTRGEDLAEATHIHVLLQRLLDLPTPIYAHHRLLHDTAGRRLAKRDQAITLRSMRAAGITPQEILARLQDDDAAAHKGSESGAA